MYECPIDVYVKEIVNKMDSDLESEIYKAIMKVGINIDKEELIRAIQYDRDQYFKGYEDARQKIKSDLTDIVNTKLKKWTMLDSLDRCRGIGVDYKDILQAIDEL